MGPFIETFGKLEHGEWVLPTATSSLVTSILSVGTLFGALFASTIADRFGRRWGIIIYVGECQDQTGLGGVGKWRS